MKSSWNNKSNCTAGAMRVEATCLWYLLPVKIVYNKCMTRKCLTLKVKVKVTEYTNWNGPIWWKISTFIKVILEHVSLAFTVSRYSHFKFRVLEYVGESWCSTFAVAPYDGKYLTFYLMAIVMVEFLQMILVKIVNWKVGPWKFRSRSLGR